MAARPTGTVTFRFTDVEGSTRQAQADAAAWSAARSRHHEIVGGAIGANEQHEPWPAASVKARMGLHTGTADWQGNDYEGYLTLARAQRVMSVAHGRHR